MSETSICCALISGDHVHADFCAHFTMAFVYADQKGLNPCIVQSQTSVVAVSRSQAAVEARKAQCSHLLFLDSDQVFPYDTITRLLGRLRADRTALVVAAAVRRRKVPHTLNFRDLGDKAGELLPTATGVREVERIGTGVMLIDMHAFNGMKKPFFRFSVDEKLGEIVGEDYLFCDQIRRDGGKILLDCDLSHQIGHIGQQTVYTTPRRGVSVTENIPHDAALPADIVAAETTLNADKLQEPT